MKTSDFYYDLPQELIAQDPLEDRSSSRLLVIWIYERRITWNTDILRDILDYLNDRETVWLSTIQELSRPVCTDTKKRQEPRSRSCF